MVFRRINIFLYFYVLDSGLINFLRLGINYVLMLEMFFREIIMLFILHGDIFSAPSDFSMGQCVSRDTARGMFRGIAVEFLKQFPGLQILRSIRVKLGTAEPVKIGDRFIYNLVSKSAFWLKPKLSSLENCLKSMKQHACLNGVRDIAIPKLGSGCDRLDFFGTVYPMVAEIFGDSLVNVHIYMMDRLHRYKLMGILTVNVWKFLVASYFESDKALYLMKLLFQINIGSFSLSLLFQCN